MTETGPSDRAFSGWPTRRYLQAYCVAFIGCGAPPPTNEPEAVAETTSALEPTVNLSGFAETLHTSGSDRPHQSVLPDPGHESAHVRDVPLVGDRMGHEQHQQHAAVPHVGGYGAAVQSRGLGQFTQTRTSPRSRPASHTFGDTVLKRGLTRFKPDDQPGGRVLADRGQRSLRVLDHDHVLRLPASDADGERDQDVDHSLDVEPGRRQRRALAAQDHLGGRRAPA